MEDIQKACLSLLEIRFFFHALRVQHSFLWYELRRREKTKGPIKVYFPSLFTSMPLHQGRGRGRMIDTVLCVIGLEM